MKIRLLLTSFVVAGLMALPALGQIAPLHVGSTNGLVDEFGLLLQGTDPGSPDFGQPYTAGDVVQILTVQTNELGVYVVQPPGTNGLPTNLLSTVIHEDRIGKGVDPALGPTGRFGTSIPALSRSGTQPIKLVARAFNAPSLDTASFYLDSELYDAPTASGAKYGVFIPQFTTLGTTLPLDGTDYDGDGLTRSWEISYGANPDNPDTDGDGMADGPEIRAGTGVTDDSSLLQMVWLTPLPPGDMGISWDSVVGKTYQIQYTTNDLAQDPVFVDVNAQVTAIDVTSTTVVTNGLYLDAAHFRVRLVE